MLSFVLDQNLGLPAGDEPWKTILSSADITAHQTADLSAIDQALAEHQPDIAYVPTADFHRLVRSGDEYYRGLAIATSKFTGDPRQSSLLVVRHDDPATGLDDLAGADYGYINTSCTSSYFSPAILVTRLGKTWDKFLHFIPVPPWQGQIDAVVSKKVRATMVLEDVWRATPENAETTKTIGRYDNCKPPVVIARKDLDEGTRGTLLDALVAWEPDWNGIFGGLKPYYYADVHPFFHDLDQLPADM
jgi:ABC-type phosphate/phosphonate transport system substrate-binding protein